MLVPDQANHAGSEEARTVGVWGVAPQSRQSGKVAKGHRTGGRL